MSAPKSTAPSTGQIPREKPVGDASVPSSSRAEQVNRVLYSIASAVNTTLDLGDLYRAIHQTLGSIIDVTNFFIALVNRRENTLYFPYHVDTEDDDFSPINDFDTGHSLTGLVVLKQVPLMLDEEQLRERAAANGVWGPLPKTWLGVPLIIREEVIGVIAVQSYTDPDLFSHEDLSLLTAVTDQIAIAIDRKQALDELVDSEHRFRQLFEQSNDAILIHNFQGTITSCNHRATEIIGYAPEQFLEMNVKDLPCREDVTAFETALAATLNRGCHRFEIVLETAGRNRLAVEISASVIDRQKGDTIQAIIRDISERKQAEMQLKQSEQKYRNLFYNAQVGLFRTKPTADTLHECNDALARMFGYDNRSDFLLQFSSKKAYVNEQDRLLFIAELSSTGSILDNEVAMYRKDGGIGWYRFSAVYYAAEDIIEGVAIDITEMRLANEEKLRLQKRLEQSQKMEALGMLAGGVAHDLNNILAGVINYPELLLMKFGDQEELRKPLEAIIESGNRAAMIVADLLTIARSAASVMQPALINDLVREYLHSPECSTLLGRSPDIKVSTRFAPSEPVISCSSVHFKKCLMNLITNAVEAIADSGTITITTDVVRETAVPAGRLSAEPDQPFILLSIQDTGGGIAGEDIEHIFEPFYTRKVMGRSGTGLGLTVVWNTMQDHGGTVQVESSTGGTTFKLFFPAASAKPDQSVNSGEQQLAQGNGESILVVDDEPQLLDIACHILSALGYTPHAVNSGEAALEFLEQQPVDLVLLDMLMEPGMNGAQAYERIIRLHPGQRAIIASGFSENSDVKSALRLGVAAFINKPYSIETLSHTLQRVFSEDKK